jgi:multidrug transporter EmrE-like cation transporter
MKNNKNNKKAIILVVICTIFTSLGQILMKIGSANTNSIIQIITNIPLILGFIAYGIGALLLIISLKYGELSLVYPFIALSFIWVSIASIYLFNEHVSLINWGGLTAIIIGVSFIGYGGEQ